jgi:hypothetical protein
VSFAPPSFSAGLGCERFGPAAAAGDLVTDGFTGTAVAQISLLCAAPSVVERHTLHRALSILNL